MIKVPYEQAVKIVVATHWDDDHIRGLGDVVQQCSEATFCMSAALNDKKFSRIVLDSPLTLVTQLKQTVNSGIDEFNTIFHALKKSHRKPEYALDNKCLWRSTSSRNRKVVSLSPHSEIFEKAMQSLISLLPTKGESIGNITAPDPNLTSVVLWLQIEEIYVLLGADMEESNQYQGWTLITGDERSRNGKADIYKVAHHGSLTGNHPDIWSKLLVENPHCLIAPWTRGGHRLPSAADLKRICSKSNNVHLSHFETKPEKIKKTRLKHRNRSFFRIKAKPLLSPLSMVRCRRKIDSPDWKIEHFGNAKTVKHENPQKRHL